VPHAAECAHTTMQNFCIWMQSRGLTATTAPAAQPSPRNSVRAQAALRASSCTKLCTSSTGGMPFEGGSAQRCASTGRSTSGITASASRASTCKVDPSPDSRRRPSALQRSTPATSQGCTGSSACGCTGSGNARLRAAVQTRHTSPQAPRPRAAYDASEPADKTRAFAGSTAPLLRPEGRAARTADTSRAPASCSAASSTAGSKPSRSCVVRSVYDSSSARTPVKPRVVRAPASHARSSGDSGSSFARCAATPCASMMKASVRAARQSHAVCHRRICAEFCKATFAGAIIRERGPEWRSAGCCLPSARSRLTHAFIASRAAARSQPTAARSESDERRDGREQ
jgi:hypothetical protein